MYLSNQQIIFHFQHFVGVEIISFLLRPSQNSVTLTKIKLLANCFERVQFVVKLTSIQNSMLYLLLICPVCLPSVTCECPWSLSFLHDNQLRCSAWYFYLENGIFSRLLSIRKCVFLDFTELEFLNWFVKLYSIHNNAHIVWSMWPKGNMMCSVIA